METFFFPFLGSPLYSFVLGLPGEVALVGRLTLCVCYNLLM